MERNQGDKGSTVYTLPHLIKLYEKDEANRTKLYPIFYSTLDSLTKKIYGFSSGELVVVAAPPAMGKRPFVLSLIVHLNSELSEVPPMIKYFSLELNAQTVFKYILSNYTGKPIYKVEEEMLDAKGEKNFQITLIKLMKRRISVDEEKFEDYLDLIERIRHDQNQPIQKSEVFVLDYLQLLGKCRNSVRETNLCLKALKMIAKEFDILIIVITKISRSIEKRKKRIPELSDLCELGKFDRYANYIFMLHRPEYYGFMEDKKGRSQAGILKVYGWRFDQQKKFRVKMRFQGQCNRVIDL